MPISSQACRSCKATGKEFRKNRRVCRDCERTASRKRSFFLERGMTHEERDQLLEQQNGVCGACGTSESGSVKGWHIDHSHVTGVVRSILCATCNIALGQVNDSQERLYLLIEYLKRHEGSETISEESTLVTETSGSGE